jgi:hypothetical protein
MKRRERHQKLIALNRMLRLSVKDLNTTQGHQKE